MMADRTSRLVPTLRFPAFQGTGEWEELKLGTLLDRMPEYGVNAAAVPYSESLPTYLRITDINDYGQFEQCSKVSVDINTSDKHYLQNGDIVLARTGASVGKSYCHREENGRLVYAGFLIRVRPNPKRLLSQFLAAYLSTRSYWDWVRLISARSGQPGINGTEYASMPLPLPPDGRDLAEQHRIADCLGSLDDLIAAESRKLDALRRHKQGLMQQLFPRPGETVPRLRFPEFREGPEWSIGALGDFATFTSGGTPSKSVPEYWNGHIPWISAASMYDTNIRDSERKVTSLAIGNGTRIAKAGSLLILTRGSMLYNRVPIGIASIDVAFNQDVRAFKIDKSLNTQFLVSLLMARESLIPINDTGIGAGKIDSEDLRRLPIVFPELSEQQKIAACLGSLDDLIAAESRKLDALRRHKQGLMQQLFPAPDRHRAMSDAT